MERFIGLMSGTSADGVDGVIATFETGRFIRVEASHHRPHPQALRHSLICLGRNDHAQVSLADFAKLDVEIADQFAATVQALLEESSVQRKDISAIGSHGQTIFHDPKRVQSSLQLGDPNRIAARTGIRVVADFRRMDVALGGEGAPLVPAFHQAAFRSSQRTAVVNLGGIANVTLLSHGNGNQTTGHDCGPANALMDEWAQKHLNARQDSEGKFAAAGAVIDELLAAWRAAPYFHLPPPKSTGRSLFNLEWAAALAPQPLAQYAPADVQATLCELTACTVAATIPAETTLVLICGGGAFNPQLMGRIARRLPFAAVRSTESAGLPPQWVEAAAFAWLAHQRIHQLPGNLPSVTGASSLAVLGGLYG